jgi:hypothetical protein
MSFRNASGTALREVLESFNNSGKDVAEIVRNMLKDGSIKAESFSIREIWDATHSIKGVTEAVSTDNFATITSELISSKVMEGYNTPDLIGDELCETVPSKVYDEKVAGLDALEGPEEVTELSEYVESGWGEKYVTSHNRKFGRLLNISEEALMMDRSQEIYRRAQSFGEKARLFREKLILYGIQDLTNYKSYYPSGVQTDLYQESLDTLQTTNALGTSGLDACWLLFSQKTDEQGDPILVSPNNAQMLVPIQLWRTSQELAKSIYVPDYPGETTQMANNTYRATFTPMTSPFINNSATSWFFGNFKRAFIWLECMPIGVFTLRPGNELEWKRDIKLSVKIRLMGSLCCIDPAYIVRNDA